MATKKKNKKKQPAPKKTSARKVPAKKASAKKPAARKKATPQKPVAKKKVAKKKTAPKRKPVSAAKAGRKKEKVYPVPSLTREPGPRSGLMSGDLQGLSGSEGADSESVDELLEEGNAFEAGIVEGVERADDSEEKEVRTRQMPEDDVPQEYLDKD
jgi:hypothetical protein